MKHADKLATIALLIVIGCGGSSTNDPGGNGADTDAGNGGGSHDGATGTGKDAGNGTTSDGGGSAETGAGGSGTLTCGSDTCDATTQVCCVSPSGQTCAPQGQCQGASLSCT